jgi:hypothetical protein
MRRLIWRWVLRPLIAVNYWLRLKELCSDRMFWADAVAVRWGYYYNPPWLARRLLAEHGPRSNWRGD